MHIGASVYHLKDFSRSLFFYGDQETPKPSFPDDYRLIARIHERDCLDTKVESVLDHAFRVTNSIDHHWSENTGVTDFSNERVLARSTSVGDVIEAGGAAYVCLPMGWEQVKETGHAESKNQEAP